MRFVVYEITQYLTIFPRNSHQPVVYSRKARLLKAVLECNYAWRWGAYDPEELMFLQLSLEMIRWWWFDWDSIDSIIRLLQARIDRIGLIHWEFFAQQFFAWRTLRNLLCVPILINPPQLVPCVHIPAGRGVVHLFNLSTPHTHTGPQSIHSPHQVRNAESGMWELNWKLESEVGMRWNGMWCNDSSRFYFELTEDFT